MCHEFRSKTEKKHPEGFNSKLESANTVNLEAHVCGDHAFSHDAQLPGVSYA
jgi:hypothetical protein